MKYNYEQLEALMLHSDFKNLSPQEQKTVLVVMSAQEYQAQRNILLESKQIFAQTPPPPSTNLGKLQAQFKAKHAVSWSSYFKHTIPTYQAVLYTVLVGSLVWSFRPTKIQYQPQIQEKVVYVTQTDTIIQEKIVLKKQVIYKTNTIELPAPPPDTVFVPVIDKQQFYKEKEDAQIFAKRKPKGKSIKEIGRLMDFVVGVDS